MKTKTCAGCEASGSDLRQVVEPLNDVRDPADLAVYNTLFRECLPQPYPARTTIINCLPPTLNYEIECVAVVPPLRPRAAAGLLLSDWSTLRAYFHSPSKVTY